MQDHDIKAPSSRQSLSAVIVVVILAGVIITRDGSPKKIQANPISTLQNQENIEESKLSAVEDETPLIDVEKLQP